MTYSPQRLRTLLIKPAGPDCNCRCAYCFYLKKQDMFPARCRMDVALLETLTRSALWEGGRPFTFIWQGGEPTLMGLDFYRTAFALQERYAPEGGVYNALQSNGLLLDGEWAALLAERRVLVGLSLDGPEDLHDAFRRAPDGKGSWYDACEAAQRLRRAGAMLNALCCVSKASEGRAREIYQWFKEAGFSYLQCFPVWETDASGRTLPFSVSPEGYGEFLIALFDAWMADRPAERLSIRQFDSMAAVLTGAPAPECGMLRVCGVYLTVEHNGSVYPCDFFVHKNHCLGTVQEAEHHGGLTGLLNSAKQRRFGAAKARTPVRCLHCAWEFLCRGGCLKFRAFTPCTTDDPSPEYVFCGSVQRFFNHAVCAFAVKPVLPAQ